ncbi:hypothetical protein [Rubellicoccus peritrichatus]|uniref:Transcription elongation factor GreAB n=1 Tax=Rubellicoccus peritrichatus TaxID=3080537 RepID=A0AAQ3LAI7_9BACT|nr:hypothetical protein [Puniceicoccus sp. CR14]WOO40989.1 hypothetical protein RZN69_20410 [Puniceicoccus sp. CR14]
MDKEVVYEALIAKLTEELNVTVGASKEAADYATNEESRAESKWDTQGLEASYLAAGQAAKAHELADSIKQLHSLKIELTSPRDTALRGALVECDLNGFAEWFYLAPAGGGEALDIEGTEVTVITQQSPIGSQLYGKSEGAAFSLPNGAPAKVKGIH